MNFEHSEKVRGLIRQVREFMEEHVLPNEGVFIDQIEANPWETPAITEELKGKARAAGLWNLLLPVEHGSYSAGLTNL